VSRPRAGRGFTLIELLVALGISSVVVMGAAVLVQGQVAAYRSASTMRARQEAGRMALDELTRNLRNAGFGVDPALVFDFGPIADMPRSAMFGYAKGAMTSYLCGERGPVRCRDRTDASDGSDELVFYSRDPEFSRPVATADTSSIVMVGDLRQPLYEGQVLQVMCLVDPKTRAYVTVDRQVDPVSPADATRQIRVALKPGQSVGGLPAFPFENQSLADGCFGLNAAVVTRVNRFRYYVQWYAEDGTEVDPQTAGGRPYLMFDPGLVGPDRKPMLVPLAQDVEEPLQRRGFDVRSLAVEDEAHSRTLSGVIGSERTSRPRWSTALATAGPGPLIGISPTPLAPKGPWRHGLSRMVTSIGGVSSVVGTR